MAFEVKTSYNEDEKIWKSEIKGEVDIYTSSTLKDSLKKTYSDPDKKSDLKIDCTNLDYIDSTGLGILIGVLKRLKLNGNKIYFTNMKDNVRKVFVVTGLDKIFVLEG